MIITDSSLSLASQHLAVSRYQKNESLKAWVGPQRPDFEGEAKNGRAVGDTVTLSGKQPTQQTQETVETDQAEAVDGLEPKLALLRNLIEMVTGRKVSVAELKKLIAPPSKAAGGSDVAAALNPQTAQADPEGQQPERAGYGIEYDANESRYEAEQTSFAARGVIRTADGKEIAFKLDLVMQREYYSESSVSLRAGDAVKKDPLVVNFDGAAAQLTDTRFNFDIDADGTTETIASLGSGSGYLTLDKNRDGVVNNGSELFGPATGNGFNELAAYDQNRDGWIDEQDTVFNELKIWQGGGDTLTSLKDAGVGAINLASQQTPFALKNSDNQLLGEVKSTGIYVQENGTVGTVQQLDLAV